MSGGSGERGPQFFKILLEDSPEQLRLPPAFVKHNVIDPSQGAQLKGPNGHIWYVHLSIRGKDTYLQYGWKKFVEDHSLKAYHLLLFTYDGNGQFTVQIFDKTACEIEAITTCNTSQEFNLRGGKKGASPDFEQYSQHKLDGIDRKNSQNDKVLSPQTSQCNKTGSTQRQHTLALKINKFKKIQTKDVHLTMSKTCSSSKENLDFSKKQLSTTKEKTKAFDEASEASKSSKFPNFLKVMNTSSVNNKFLVSVPAYFFREYCPKQKTSFFLWDPKERGWEVNFIPQVPHKGILSGGWQAFSKGNNLREGDVCLFELVGECQMQVRIFPSEMSPPAPVKSSEETKLLKRASDF
ncbi:hypothetical protein MRB53_007399 [Persea americana]|uniref:Uncharacterized protein n=1 Tax=Persea americana TaxID=3435 RepID=A0ACC2MJS4_PERAE|nr:hypothetical protein MRB53_007399 [Persea americana]